MKAPKIFSFFSGSGFLDLGFEMSGYAVDLVNEYSSSDAYGVSPEESSWLVHSIAFVRKTYGTSV